MYALGAPMVLPTEWQRAHFAWRIGTTSAWNFAAAGVPEPAGDGEAVGAALAAGEAVAAGLAVAAGVGPAAGVAVAPAPIAGPVRGVVVIRPFAVGVQATAARTAVAERARTALRMGILREGAASA
jgi:hypothetical protein